MQMSKSKTTKYKITDTNIDKKFIGKNLDLERVKAKGGPGDGGRKPGSKNKMTLDKLANIVMGMSNDIKDIKNDVVNLNNRFDNLVKVNNLKE